MKSIEGHSVFVVIIALVFSLTASSTLAASSWDDQAPNTLYGNFNEAMANKISSGEFEILNLINFYKKETDKKPVFYVGYSITGVSNNSTTTRVLSDSKSNIIYEEGNGKKATSYQMDMITKSNNIYVKFPDSTVKQIKNKWINIPSDKYSDFGKVMQPALFDAGLIVASTTDGKVSNIIVKLAKKHNLFVHWDDIEDDYVVDNAKRYNLAYNRNAIVPFYKELSQTLSFEDKKQTILSIDGFKKSLAKSEFVDYLLDNSYVSLWIDNETNLPTRIIQVLQILPVQKKEPFALFLSDISITKVNQLVLIEKPVNALSFVQATKALKINMEDNSDVVVLKITDLKKQLSKAKTKDDKALLNYLIAQKYDEISDSKNAAKYFKVSASQYSKDSADKYDALAQAEWSLGNTKKVKEYYEKAVIKEPKNDYILNSYGYFLNGISPVTADSQDLNLALTINTRLVKGVVNDSNLLNLYITYILLGRDNDALALKSKFDNFETAGNYNALARAYHRKGDKKSEDKYAKLAESKGHIRGLADDEFFALSFK